MIKDPEAVHEFLTSGSPAEGQCELTVPLKPPFLLKLYVKADGKAAGSMMDGLASIKAVSAGPACTPDALASKTVEQLQAEVQSAPVAFGAELCIDGELLTDVAGGLCELGGKRRQLFVGLPCIPLGMRGVHSPPCRQPAAAFRAAYRAAAALAVLAAVDRTVRMAKSSKGKWCPIVRALNSRAPLNSDTTSLCLARAEGTYFPWLVSQVWVCMPFMPAPACAPAAHASGIALPSCDRPSSRCSRMPRSQPRHTLPPQGMLEVEVEAGPTAATTQDPVAVADPKASSDLKLGLEGQASLVAKVGLKLKRVVDTPPCVAAAASPRMYEAVACAEACRYDPDPPLKRLKVSVVTKGPW